MLITDSLLLDYKRCSRRAFLNIHGDPTQQDPERDFLQKLRQESKRHIASVLDTFYSHYQPSYTSGANWREKAQLTEQLMQQGVDCIYQGILWVDDSSSSKHLPDDFLHFLSSGDEYLGKPHLLIKQPGQSKFGDWSYYPVSIHLGRKAKPEYKLIVTLLKEMVQEMGGWMNQGSLSFEEMNNKDTLMQIGNEVAIEMYEICPGRVMELDNQYSNGAL